MAHGFDNDFHSVCRKSLLMQDSPVPTVTGESQQEGVSSATIDLSTLRTVAHGQVSKSKLSKEKDFLPANTQT